MSLLGRRKFCPIHYGLKTDSIDQISKEKENVKYDNY